MSTRMVRVGVFLSIGCYACFFREPRFLDRKFRFVFETVNGLPMKAHREIFAVGVRKFERETRLGIGQDVSGEFLSEW